MEQASLKLWNTLVDLSRKKDCDLGENREVRMRHLVCQVLRALPISPCDDGVMTKRNRERNVTLFRFLTRTGKMWTEASVPNKHLAVECWDSAKELWECIMDVDGDSDEDGDNDLTSREFKTHFFNYLMTLVEFHSSEKKYEKARSIVQQAIECSCDQSQRFQLLSTTYSIGQQLHESSETTEALKWFEISLELESNAVSLEKDQKARLLRLMSNCFLELGSYDQALVHAEAANCIVSHPAGHYLIAKTKLATKADDAVDTLKLFLSQNFITFELSICILKAAVLNSMFDGFLEAFDVALPKFLNDPDKYEKLCFLKLEALISHFSDTTMALSFLEKLLSDHNLGSHRLSGPAQQQISFFIWNTATTFYISSDYMNALVWYRLCAPLLSEDNRSQCFRVVGRCYLLCQELNQALEWTLRAKDLDPDAISCYFLLYDIYLETGRVVDAFECLHHMTRFQSSAEFLEASAILAVQKRQQALAIQAFEGLLSITASNLERSKKGFFCKVARTLLQTCLELKDSTELQDKIASTIVTFTKSLDVSDTESISRLKDMVFANALDEIQWMNSFAWNSAVGAVEKKNFTLMHELFTSCLVLCRYLPDSSSLVETRMNCLVYSAIALLRTSKGRNKPILEDVMRIIKQCRELKSSLESNGVKLDKAIEIALVSVEFESLLHLCPPNLVTVLAKLNELSIKPIKKASILAELGMIAEPVNKKLASQLLQESRQIFVAESEFGKSCQITRNLISVYHQERKH
eukprot:TRINITY_DN1834_c0_g1_i3.p1 TRINITY_DN1834_c0_g1~~TRINITY_DN1834_c0_g1_i3.p1  ORF type:complete len:803 (-),score=111.23 TRINITY_DN1834_c0_g1_i3:42-2297(-)